MRKIENIETIWDTFICSDCQSELQQLPDNCIDLVFTSPPYADQRIYDQEEDSTIDPDDYVSWFADKAREIYRVLKTDGSFVLNINDKTVDGFQHLFVYELVIYLCREIGFHLVRDYIWYNPATPPNIFSRGNMGRTKKSHEYCFWFSKGSTWTFNLDPIRKPYGKDMKKYLDGNGKGQRNDNTRPSTHNFNCEKTWADHGGSDPGSVIEIANTASNGMFFKMCKELGITHPARFPVKLADFFILSATNPGDIVLDPFSGSGTTAVSALHNRRHWIGIDSNKSYCELAQKRIDMELTQLSDKKG